MAQVKLLKINASGLPQEMDTTADEVTLLTFTVTGGGAVLSGTGLDMNDTAISDTSDLSFNDPTTDGITNTSGTHPADKIMFEDEENSMDVGSAILFPVVADDADQLDAMRLPAIAGVPTATPTDGGEGYLVWDSTNDHLYAWNGTSWDNLSTVDEAKAVCNDYTSGEILAAVDAVYISGSNEVSKAKADADATTDAIGFAATGVGAAATVSVCSEGVLAGFTGLSAGSRYFLSGATAGLITTTPPGANNTVYQMGFAKSATELHIKTQYLGKKL